MSFDDHMSKLAENRENIEDRNVGPDEFSHDQWALARFGSTYGDEEELDTERKENDCFDHLVPDDMVDCYTYGDHDPGFHPTEEVLYSKCKYCYLDWRIPSFPDGTTILTPDVYEGDVEVQGVAIDPYDDNAAYSSSL